MTECPPPTYFLPGSEHAGAGGSRESGVGSGVGEGGLFSGHKKPVVLAHNGSAVLPPPPSHCSGNGLAKSRGGGPRGGVDVDSTRETLTVVLGPRVLFYRLVWRR